MWLTLLYFAIGVGIFAVLYLLLKHSSKMTENVLSVSASVIKTAKEISKVFDKNPAEKSFFEKMLDYAEIAVASVEQSYKDVKEQKKKALEDGEITKEEMKEIYTSMKLDAINIAKKLAELDGYELSNTEINILGYIIEAMVLFLPKSKS